ncbi:MAG: QsdR family transcriptional regulator [Solirubrobacterales bacterium]
MSRQNQSRVSNSALRGPGRPAAASREDVLDAGLYRYLRGRRVDVQAIAGELGLGRATIYRWFGSREKLLGEIIIRATEPVLAKARAGLRGKGGPGLLDTFDRFNRALADAPALRSFVEQEREAALRIIASGAGLVQPRMVELIAGLIAEEAEAGTYQPPVEPAALGYAIVRLAEAFLFNDAVAGIRGDVDRLREVEAALLGVPAQRSRSFS